MKPKKNILITGCSTGIGREAALTLDQKGWRVFATCRSNSDCQFFHEVGIESFQLDLSDEKSIMVLLQFRVQYKTYLEMPSEIFLK